MKAYLAVRNLALDYGLTERRVWEIMKNTDIAPPKSTAQASLFAA